MSVTFDKIQFRFSLKYEERHLKRLEKNYMYARTSNLYIKKTRNPGIFMYMLTIKLCLLTVHVHVARIQLQCYEISDTFCVFWPQQHMQMHPENHEITC